jgi:CRP-like cAMP-binding protein
MAAIDMDGADLAAIPLFSSLSDVDRGRVATVARRTQWNAGHIVVNEGEFAFDFYAIRDGEVNVQRGGQPVRVLRAGDFFGELGVVPSDAHRWSRRRSATVVVTLPTTAIRISGSDFRGLVQDIPALGNAVRAAAAERRRRDSDADNSARET